ncbi:fimbrial protein [Burkholderia cepacia]|uniref:fimbrial protein n=1 Tax=Burkholderia cepacia TaxID=292 RepID=UPI002ABD5F4D|nr:fimbrial protein [Burkholderia cepacia]
MASHTHARVRNRNRATRVAAAFGMLLLWAAGTGTAHAATATCVNTSSSKLGELPSSFRIAADVPIGTVLWRKTGIEIAASCWMKVPGSGGVEATLYRWMDDPDLAANGLTLYVTYNGDRGHGTSSLPMGTTIKSFGKTPVTATVDIELVKSGTTPSVARPFPVLSVLTVLIGGPNNSTADATRYVTYGFDNISFQPTTCKTTTPAVSVELGNHALGRSSGIGSGAGSTSKSKGFAIGLSCDTGVAGAFDVNLMLEGTAVDASNGVLALSSKSTALGVGIQLLKSDGTPVKLGTPWKVSGPPSTSASFTVPLSARYYQTGASATPGIANGSATFTVIYR